MVGLALLDEARRAGLEIQASGEVLKVRGPRSAEPLARELLEHKEKVLALLQAQERAEWDRALQQRLAAFRARQEQLSKRVEAGCDFLAGLAKRIGQDSPEYDRYFAAWEKLLREYETVSDRIEYLELTARIRSACTAE